MPEEVRKIVHDYEEGKITRRQFIRRIAVITGSIAAASHLLASLSLPGAYAAQVDPNDPSLDSGNIEYDGKAGKISAFLSRPEATGSYPGLIVIHENRGLNDHILDVARRFAKEGYVALAPDYLSRHGGTQKVNPEGKGLRNMRKLATVETGVEDTQAGFDYLRGLSQVQKKTGSGSWDFAGAAK